MRRAWVAVALVGGGTLGCPSLSPYSCRDDADCDREGAVGVCLADDVCAYPVDAARCPSGYARTPNAAVDPGACVDPSASSTSTGHEDTGPPPADDDGGSSSDSGVAMCGSKVDLTIETLVIAPGEVLEGYPLLVALDDVDLARALDESAEPPFVVDADGQPLAHEIDTLDPQTGEIRLWVRLPSYTAAEPLPIALRLGTPPPNGAPDPTAVWAGNYVGVWHLGDGLTGGDNAPIRNSATMTEPGFTGGGMAVEQSVPGVVGRALLFDGDDDIVTVDASYIGSVTSYTVSLWARFDGAGDISRSFFQRINGGYFYPRCWRLPDESGGNPICQYQIEDTTVPLGAGGELPAGGLVHLSLSRDADALHTEVWRDALLVNDSDDPPGDIASGDNPLEIGHGEWGTFDGMIDEFRISARALPSSWHVADDRIVRDPSSALLEVGSIEPVPCE